MKKSGQKSGTTKRPARAATKAKPEKAAKRIVGPRRAAAPSSAAIRTDDDITVAIRALRRRCPFMRKAHDLAGQPPLRQRPGGFTGLVRIVNGQQLSVASASAIYARVEATVRPLDAATLLAASDETLRGCGLSRPKIKTLRAIATAVADGLDLDAVADLPEDDAMAQLTAVSGIGPWTAEIYLMFCTGRADVFASGDLALQIAAQNLLDLETRPTARELAAIAAERWRPWRAVAALLLWAYYAEIKKQGIAIPV